jgi:predicted transcriptional regulator
MSETFFIRSDEATELRLEALTICAGIGDVDAGESVSHEKVAAWLETWGTPGEMKAPQ